MGTIDQTNMRVVNIPNALLFTCNTFTVSLFRRVFMPSSTSMPVSTFHNMRCSVRTPPWCRRDGVIRVDSLRPARGKEVRKRQERRDGIRYCRGIFGVVRLTLLLLTASEAFTVTTFKVKINPEPSPAMPAVVSRRVYGVLNPNSERWN